MTTTYKGVQLFYNDTGKGDVILLLHGFLENSSMWNFLIPILSKNYRVISIDLLGHGKTGCTGYIHTMEEMAAAITVVIDHLELAQISIIGHSMGGYVGCAFAKAYPEKLKALCLLNSSPLPDDDERKLLRTRANEMAKKQYSQLVRMSFANLFQEQTKKGFGEEISLALDQALQTPPQGYIAANSGMRLREDNSKLWKLGNFRKGFILGEDDWIIDSELHKITFKNYCNYFQIIPGGHMSHIGQKSLLIDSISRFISMSNQKKQ